MKTGRWKIVIPALAALAIGYTLWVSVCPVQQGAFGVIPWIVLGWCLLPVLAMLMGMGQGKDKR
jgi:hypothetical protein